MKTIYQVVTELSRTTERFQNLFSLVKEKMEVGPGIEGPISLLEEKRAASLP